MREYIDKKSAVEGRKESRLPTFSPEWVARLKGTADYLGLTYYTTHLVKPAPLSSVQGWSADSETERYLDPEWPGCGSSWLKSVPWGLRKLLCWIKDEYNNPEIIITENGTSDNGGLQDNDRIKYYRAHINETLKAVKLDGCNVRGYTAWTLMDNFEWNAGYT